MIFHTGPTTTPNAFLRLGVGVDGLAPQGTPSRGRGVVPAQLSLDRWREIRWT